MTTIFSSGWESSGGSDASDGGAWSGTYGVTVTGAIVHNGSYAAYSNTNFGTVYKNGLNRAGDTYAVAYIRMETLPTSGNAVTVLALQNSSLGEEVGVRIYNDGSTMYWGLSKPSGNSYQAATINTGVWYKVQIRRTLGSGSGIATLWVGESQLLTSTTETIANNTDYIQAGIIVESGSDTVYMDDVLVSDVYVAASYYPYIQQVSDVDSTADVGTHSAFANQQSAADSTYDTLTEADTDSDTSTFGRSSSTGSSYRTTAANEMRLGVFDATQTGEVASIVFYGRGSATAQNCKAIICDSSGNLLTNGVGSAVSVSTTAANKTLTFADPKPIVTNGTTYWIGLITAGAVRIYYSSTTGGTSKQDTTNSYTTPTSPTDASSTTETWRQMLANVNEINYELQIEEQFTEVPAGGQQLHVTTGTLSKSLTVKGWNGASWDTLGTLSASTDNNLGDISSYVDSGNAYIQFYATGGSTQGTYQIDSVYLVGVDTYTKSFSADGTLKANLSKSFTAGGILLQNLTKTFTCDGRLLAGFGKSFTLNGILKQNLTKTFTADGILQKEQSKSYSFDAILLQPQIYQFDYDGILTQSGSKEFNYDAILTANLTKAYTLDGILQKNLEKSFSLDAILQAELTKAFNFDAYLLAAQYKSFSVDGILTGTLTKTFNADGILIGEIPKTFTIDALLEAPVAGTKSYSYNGLLFGTLTKNFTFNAFLQAITVEVPSSATGYRATTRRKMNPHMLTLIRRFLEAELDE